MGKGQPQGSGSGSQGGGIGPATATTQPSVPTSVPGETASSILGSTGGRIAGADEHVRAESGPREKGLGDQNSEERTVRARVYSCENRVAALSAPRLYGFFS